MNISSVGSSLQYMAAAGTDTEGALVMGKVLDQAKVEGQDTQELIASAAPAPQSGHALSVYA
jgi:hypothetical protein